MSEENETILRNALDAVDRGRRWGLIGIAALFFAVAIALASVFGGAAANRAPSNGALPMKALYVASATGMLFVACCTVIIVFHVTRMTKSILRAIESKK
jgi:hypothetical protein